MQPAAAALGPKQRRAAARGAPRLTMLHKANLALSLEEFRGLPAAQLLEDITTGLSDTVRVQRVGHALQDFAEWLSRAHTKALATMLGGPGRDSWVERARWNATSSIVSHLTGAMLGTPTPLGMPLPPTLNATVGRAARKMQRWHGEALAKGTAATRPLAHSLDSFVTRVMDLARATTPAVRARVR